MVAVQGPNYYDPPLHMHMITYQNHAGDKQKSYKIMRMNIFEVQDKAKPVRENITGLNLVVVKHMTIVA
jgi:hypothetical protein